MNLRKVGRSLAAGLLIVALTGTAMAESYTTLRYKDQGESVRQMQTALNALQGEKYTRILPFVRPANGGITLREVSGCSSWCIAYWDGKHLWLPGEKDGQWRGCLPSDPDQLDKILKSTFNK